MHPLGALAAVILAGLMSLPGEATAALTAAACFGSRMVLQQGMPLPVWGRAEPGARVTVSFGRDRWEAEADATGGWRVVLPPQQASRTARSMVISSDIHSLTLHDILVGEVWLCAGQSNMLMPLARVAAAKGEIESARHPLLRLFRVDAAAGGDGGAYPPETIAALEPSRYATGEWEACTPAAAAKFSAVGYFFGEQLLDRLGVPVGVVCIAVGGTPAEAWVSREALARDPKTQGLVRGDWLGKAALDGWCKERARENLGRAFQANEPIPGDQTGPNHPFKPGFLWEAAVAPWVPYGLRGVIWYQGESNADSAARVDQHNDIFPLLVADWRRAWRRESLPFGIIQLPGMNRPDWPAFREGQRRLAASISDTGLIVTIDLGDPRDVHPRDKRPVGERSAAWALASVYGQGGPATGPLPRVAECTAAGTIAVRFRETGGTLTTTDGAAPRHVEAIGEDGAAVAVSCRIEGDSLILEPETPDSITTIRHVRHAWQPFPRPPVNLTGSTGLPATPFRVGVRSHVAQE